MNSPTRYRGRDITTGEPIFGSLVQRRCRQYFIFTDDHEYRRVSSRHLCLFTGIQDKNGADLYEEDHVRRDSDQTLYQIQYLYAGFWLVSKRMRLPITESMILVKEEPE